MHPEVLIMSCIFSAGSSIGAVYDDCNSMLENVLRRIQEISQVLLANVASISTACRYATGNVYIIIIIFLINAYITI
jgi:hypothetical protein